MAWHNAAFYLKVVPISLLLAIFIAMVAYVSWSIHIFTPVPLRIQMDCSNFLGEQGKQHLEAYKQNRTVLQERNNNMTTMCWTIRKRRYLPTDVPDSMEVLHHMYFVRIVSKNYDFLEEVMAMMYSPLHFYCFVIDSSASPRFEELVRTLGRCVLNIIVPPNTYDTSTARGTFLAINSCYVGMEDFPWRHTIISEESEIPIHSVHYIADNAKRLRDAARIGRVTISEEHARILGDDDFFKASHQDQEYLRRTICSWLDNRRFPLVLPRSFQIPLLKFVGAQNFENCQPLSVDFDRNVALDVCRTNRYDNRSNCVVGMEDYDYATKSRNLFVKADPNFDHGIVQCVNEFVYRRTYKMDHENIIYG